MDEEDSPSAWRARLSVAAAASIISGAAWLAWEVSRRAWDDGASSDCAGSADYFNDATFAIATVAAALALAAIAGLVRGSLRAVALVGAIGAFAIGTGNAAEHCASEALFLLYVAGSLVYVVASVALAAGLFARAHFGRWPPLLLGVAALGLMLGAERGGAALTGAAWIGFGVSLLKWPEINVSPVAPGD